MYDLEIGGVGYPLVGGRRDFRIKIIFISRIEIIK